MSESLLLGRSLLVKAAHAKAKPLEAKAKQIVAHERMASIATQRDTKKADDSKAEKAPLDESSKAKKAPVAGESGADGAAAKDNGRAQKRKAAAPADEAAGPPKILK